MSQWRIDPDHSVAAFSIRHMMICNVRGQFNKISGTITYDAERPETSSVEAAIEAASIYTGIAKRDEHLRSSDFFDAAACPAINFKSTKVEKSGEGRLRVFGDLTIRCVTRPVAFEAEISGPVKSPFGDETTIGFTASTSLDREEFGVSWNEAMEGGGFIVGKEVLVYLDVEADLVE